jgi:hypothetical protein
MREIQNGKRVYIPRMDGRPSVLTEAADRPHHDAEKLQKECLALTAPPSFVIVNGLVLESQAAVICLVFEINPLFHDTGFLNTA